VATAAVSGGVTVGDRNEIDYRSDSGRKIRRICPRSQDHWRISGFHESRFVESVGAPGCHENGSCDDEPIKQAAERNRFESIELPKVILIEDYKLVK
jgi:hypothetical protein